MLSDKIKELISESFGSNDSVKLYNNVNDDFDILSFVDEEDEILISDIYWEEAFVAQIGNSEIGAGLGTGKLDFGGALVKIKSASAYFGLTGQKHHWFKEPTFKDIVGNGVVFGASWPAIAGIAGAILAYTTGSAVKKLLDYFNSISRLKMLILKLQDKHNSIDDENKKQQLQKKIDVYTTKVNKLKQQAKDKYADFLKETNDKFEEYKKIKNDKTKSAEVEKLKKDLKDRVTYITNIGLQAEKIEKEIYS